MIHVDKLIDRGKGLVLLSLLVAVAIPGESRADVSRIREMALELEQKLARHRYEVAVKGEESNTARIYKDYDFILKKNKVEEVAGAMGTDPHAERLRLYLIESIVNAELAPFVDDLVDFEQKASADLDGETLSYTEVMKRLAVTPDDGDRRKIASLLPPLAETSAVFRREIGKRRNELYQPWGFANFGEFYVQREAMDLAAVGDLADTFLQESQALYDSLFEAAAELYLGVEARKVRFVDLPFLTQGTAFESAFPSGERLRRLRGLFNGLGVAIADNPEIDNTVRRGKRLRAGAYPVVVPTEVHVGLNPKGMGVRTSNEAVYAVGEALLYSLSTHPGLEDGYLVRQPAQAAMAWIPRFVLDEPGWIRANVNTESFSEPDYLFFRAFVSLYEARFLAALVKFEALAYGGAVDHEKEFRELMRETTWTRLSTNDATRSLEYLSELKAASKFQGLLVAAGVREHLRQTLGDDWYASGKAGPVLKPLWAQGGALTLDAIAQSCPHTVSPAIFIQNIESILAASKRP